MQIAYYSFGNVPRPRGTLHNDVGEPILEKGEVVLAQDNDAGFELTRIPSSIVGQIFPTMIFPDIGSGELYRTDRRIMFFRIPPISHYAEARHSWLDDPLEFMRLAKGWLQKGYRESVVIPISEVKKTVRKRHDREVVLHVLFDGERYIARFTPSVRPFM